MLRAADRAPAPWKNGGGTTWEIAAQPPGAGLDAFDWRLSIAEVASAGPFSVFPGVDRVLTVIAGEGLRLSIDGQGEALLDETAAPLAFPGDAPASAALDAGPIRDLNLMVRRGAWRGRARRLANGEQIVAKADVTVLAALAPARVKGETLAAEDAVVVEPGETLAVEGSLLLIEIDRA
nr:HutD family protein [Caulobacter hibisci]